MPAQFNNKAADISSRVCANCGALEDPLSTALSACARSHLVSYCRKPCHAQYFRQIPGSHKQWRLATTQPNQNETMPAPGITKAHSFPTPVSTLAKCDECAVCLEPLGPSSVDCCTLTCFRVFHVPCAEGLRLFGIKQFAPCVARSFLRGRSSFSSMATGFSFPWINSWSAARGLRAG